MGPTTELGTFTWGYVSLDPPVPDSVWLMSAAPFLADALLAVLGALLATWFWRRGRRVWWIATVLLLIVGAISTNVWGWWFSSSRGNSDVDKLLRVLPDWLVHGWFAVTTAAYVAALVWTLRDCPTRIGSAQPA